MLPSHLLHKKLLRRITEIDIEKKHDVAIVLFKKTYVCYLF